MSLNRKLHFYETICASMNINFMLQFEADNLNIDHLKQAFVAVKKKHPYFRMRLNKSADNSLEFLEESLNQLDEIQIENIRLDSIEDLNNWQERLILSGSRMRDNSISLIHFNLYSFENNHQLIGSINHSGIIWLFL
jgi:hypothetical protein